MHHGIEFTAVFLASVILVAGAALRGVCGRLRMPYTLAVLLLGLLLGVLLDRSPAAPAVELLGRGTGISPELILFVFLPALIFESAFALEVHAFRKILGTVILLAVPALAVTVVLLAGVALVFAGPAWGWGLSAALVFGALMAATDPVAVVALLHEIGAPRKLALRLEGESLLNDGTAIVAFTVLLGMLTQGARLDPGAALVTFLEVTLGGLLVGAAMAAFVSWWLSRTFNEPLVEITLTLVLAYLAMLVAEGFLHVSGVMAVVAAGLWMSGPGRTNISPEVSHFLHRFWQTLSFLVNTLIFFLVGLVISTHVNDAALEDLGVIAGVYVGVVAARFAVVHLHRPAMAALGDPLTTREVTVMSWGGMRGAVSLALALVISQHPELPTALREQVLLLTAGVVLLTIEINGSTMGWLLRRMGFDRPPPGDRLAALTTRSAVLEHVRREVDRVKGDRDLRAVDWDQVLGDLARREAELASEAASTRAEIASGSPQERASGFWRQVLGIERRAYWSAFAEGTLGARSTQILDHEVDLHLDLLSSGCLEPPPTRVQPATGWRRRLERWRGAPFDLLALRYDLVRGQVRAAEQVLSELDGMPDLDEDLRKEIGDTYRRYRLVGQELLEDMRTHLPEVTTAIETRLAHRIELNFERAGYLRQARLGSLEPGEAERCMEEVEGRMKALRRSVRLVELPPPEELIRRIPLFAALGAEDLGALAALAGERVLGREEVLFHQGDRGGGMFLVARGALLVTDARGVLLDVLGGGDLVGEMALVTGEPRSASVRTATTAVLVEIPREGFTRLLAERPRLRSAVARTFARRRFEDCLRADDRFHHLGHSDRVDWFAQGRLEEVAAGATLRVEAPTRAFLALGRLRRGDGVLGAPGFVDLDSGEIMTAEEESWVALLPPALERTVAVPEVRGGEAQ